MMRFLLLYTYACNLKISLLKCVQKKVWCDWMVRQQSVWNPPPCFNDYNKIASEPWPKLAALVTLLDNNQFCSQQFCSEQKSGEF